MTYEEWERGVPAEIKADVVWRVKAYRLGLFISDLACLDAKALWKSAETREIADQMTRSAWRICACVAEGYSRDTHRGRSVLYEYALGSARETRDWYYKARHALSLEVVQHRMKVCAELVPLLVTMVANERKSKGRVSEE